MRTIASTDAMLASEGGPDTNMPGDLRRWLAENGLAAHAERFVADRIDWDILGDLTDEDLRDLGLSLGDRKRLLRAIAALGTPAHSDGTDWAVEGDAARRQITVMFVDLVDSTPLAEMLDPEDLRDVLRSFQATCVAAIEAHDGHVARYMGDGILAYFGYPEAHEDDAVRAVRAGLRIIEDLRASNDRRDLNYGVRLRSRIGVHTGLVVVGEIGAGSMRDRDGVVGETPNIAARLQGEAQPDTLMLGAPTRRLVEGQFELEDLGPLRLKGVSGPVRAWRAVRSVDVVDRFDARTRGGMTEFIGRDAELNMLNQRWLQACDGEMRCVLVVGEAGIGKSRLLRAFRDGLAGQPHQTITLYCSPYHSSSAFAPLSDWLCRALQLQPRSDPEGAVVALRKSIVGLGLAEHKMMPLLTALLGLPSPDPSSTGDASTAQFRRQAVEATAEVIAALTHRQPVVMLVEDAHWIDPSSHELLHELLEQLTNERLFLLVTARPEFTPGWSYAHAVQVNLDRLSRRDRAAMVERVAGGKKLPEFVLEQIVTKTDGVPLFVEELTKTVLEGGVLLDVGDRYELSGTFAGISIPDTLQGSLLARLDRLDTITREIAQIGAAIGREFGRDLLALVTRRTGETLDLALRQLVAADILQPAPRSSWGKSAYAFRHALIQETAYSSLLLVRRRQYHGAIAEVMLSSFPEMADMLPEIVAQHLTAADQVDSAIDAWLRAGERARRRGAHIEAQAHLERGLDLVSRLPEAARAPRSVPILMAKGSVETQLANRRSLETFREVARLVRALGLKKELVDTALGYADAEIYVNTPTIESVRLLEEALEVVGEADSLERCRTLSYLARMLFYGGETERAQDVRREAERMLPRFNDRYSLRELLWCELLHNSAPPPRASEFAERRRRLQLLNQISVEIGDEKQRNHSAQVTSAAFLEMGDVEEYGVILQRYGQPGTFPQSRLDRWLATCMKALDTMQRGDFPAAERHAREAVEFGDGVDFEAPYGVYGLQMFTIRREQGRLAEVAPLLRRFVDEYPEETTWRPGLMVIASDLGFEAQARQTFGALAESGFTLPMDVKRSLTLSYLAEVCCRLHDRTNAERLYELFLPYRDLAVVVGVATVCCGAAARFLGMLAATMRDWKAADAHFEAALAMDERMKGWPWLVHTRFEYARALLSRGRKQDIVRAQELRGMALAGAERLGMTSLSRCIADPASMA